MRLHHTAAPWLLSMCVEPWASGPGRRLHLHLLLLLLLLLDLSLGLRLVLGMLIDLLLPEKLGIALGMSHTGGMLMLGGVALGRTACYSHGCLRHRG